jgi:hypothetical protein
MRQVETRGMSITAPLTPSHGPAATEPPGDVLPARARRPTFTEAVADIVPVIGVVFVAGPPVVFIAGPWLFLVLMLSGAFAVLVAFVALWVAATVLLTTLAGVVATPYLLVRGLVRRHRISRAAPIPGAHVPSLESRQVVA